MPMEIDERRLEYLVDKVKLPYQELTWYEVNYRRCFQIRDSSGGIASTYISYLIQIMRASDGHLIKAWCLPIEYSPMWSDDRILTKLQDRAYDFARLRGEFDPDGGDLGREK